MDQDRKGRVHFYISLGVSIVLLALVVWFVDFRQVWPALTSLDPLFLLALLGLAVAHHVIMYCDRWNRMLSYIGYKHSLNEVILVHLGTGPLHLLMPIQTGEAVTAYALARRGNNPVAVYFGTIAYGKYLNLIATLGILVIGLAFTKKMPLADTELAMAVFLAIMLLGISLEIKPIRGIFLKVAGRFGDRVANIVNELFAVYEDVSIPRKLFLLAYSFAFQFLEVVFCKLLFDHMGIVVPFPTLMAFIGLIMLATSVPITIAGVGTREALCIPLLAPFADKPTAVAAGITYTFTQYIWPMIVGVPWMRKVLASSFLEKKQA